MLDQLFTLRNVTSIAGALMILFAFGALQRGRLSLQHRSYHLLNFVGAAILAGFAVLDRNLGIVLLEGTWALLSVPGLIRPQAAKGAH